MDRRRFLRTSVLAGAGLAAAPLVGRGRAGALSGLLSEPAAQAAKGRSSGGCLWGVHADPRGSENPETALTDLEQRVGRMFALERHYSVWDELIPSNHMLWTHAQGRIPYIGWQAWRTNGTLLKWADIASGAYDGWVRTQAQSIAQAACPMYFNFHHEPEDDPKCGNAQDYRSAFDHVHNVFANQGVSNVTWVFTLMSSTFRGYAGGPAVWEPNAYDVVGVDGYNRHPCSPKPYKSFTELFTDTRAFAGSRGKPMALGEFGCVEQDACGHSGGDPKGKAKWITDAGQVIKSWPEVIWVSYSHVNVGRYDYWVDTSRASLDAYTTVGQDPYFN